MQMLARCKDLRCPNDFQFLRVLCVCARTLIRLLSPSCSRNRIFSRRVTSAQRRIGTLWWKVAAANPLRFDGVCGALQNMNLIGYRWFPYVGRSDHAFTMAHSRRNSSVFLAPSADQTFEDIPNQTVHVEGSPVPIRELFRSTNLGNKGRQ